MARQIKLFPAEEMQEDIISMENIEAPTKKVNLEDKNSLFTPIVQEEPKQNIEPFEYDVFQKPYSYGPDITWVIAGGPMDVAPGEQVIFTFADLNKTP